MVCSLICVIEAGRTAEGTLRCEAYSPLARESIIALDAINLEAETREQNGGYMSEENKPIEKDAEKKKPEELTIASWRPFFVIPS
jgi:hypothetical protein